MTACLLQPLVPCPAHPGLDRVPACLFPRQLGFFIFSVFDSQLLLLLGCPSPVLLADSGGRHLYFHDRK